MTKKWNAVNDQPNGNYDGGNEITYNTKVLNSNICDQNNDHILVRGNITIIEHQVTQVHLKIKHHLLNV